MHHSHRSSVQIRRWLEQVLADEGGRRPPGSAWLLGLLPWAILGVVISASCHLNRIVAAVPGLGPPKSALQRLRRWLMRASFRTVELLPAVARPLLSRYRQEPLLLLVDRTEWKHANLLFAAVPFRGRAVPVALMLLDGPKATNDRELRQLLEQAAAAMPSEAQVVVVGDREFGNVPAMRAIASLGWQFCLRFKQDTWLLDAQGHDWQARDRFPQRGGRRCWTELRVTLQRYGPLQVTVFWRGDEPEPWILVSDRAAQELPRLYRSRMRIEEMFSDLKKRGFDLEASRLREGARILRLVGLLCLAYVWLLLAAAVAIRRGWRRLTDVARSRALSYLQIGLRLLRFHPEEVAASLARAVTRMYHQRK